VYYETNEILIVKKLRRWVIDPRIQHAGSQENPYHEIAAQRLVGDDQHVASIVDALWNDRYLFVVMRDLGQDLLKSYPRLQPALSDEANKRRFVYQLLLDLEHIQQHSLIHRDISPENVLMTTTSPQEPILFPLIDLAMALQAPVVEGVAQRIAPQPWGGKFPYTSPESLHQDDQGMFDNPLDFGVDIWSMGVVILLLFTGARYWEKPQPVDLGYQLFVLEGGLHQDDVLNRALDFWLQHEPANAMVTIIAQLQQLDPLLRRMLARMLHPNPDERATVQELFQEPWFQFTSQRIGRAGP
jgi:serine/threonine protein kinase